MTKRCYKYECLTGSLSQSRLRRRGQYLHIKSATCFSNRLNRSIQYRFYINQNGKCKFEQNQLNAYNILTINSHSFSKLCQKEIFIYKSYFTTANFTHIIKFQISLIMTIYTFKAKPFSTDPTFIQLIIIQLINSTY